MATVLPTGSSGSTPPSDLTVVLTMRRGSFELLPAYFSPTLQSAPLTSRTSPSSSASSRLQLRGQFMHVYSCLLFTGHHFHRDLRHLSRPFAASTPACTISGGRTILDLRE